MNTPVYVVLFMLIFFAGCSSETLELSEILETTNDGEMMEENESGLTFIDKTLPGGKERADAERRLSLIEELASDDTSMHDYYRFMLSFETSKEYMDFVLNATPDDYAVYAEKNGLVNVHRQRIYSEDEWNIIYEESLPD